LIGGEVSRSERRIFGRHHPLTLVLRFFFFTRKAADEPPSEDAHSADIELAVAPEDAGHEEDKEAVAPSESSKKRTADVADVVEEEMVSEKKMAAGLSWGG
jgi:hypothetical protein